MISALIVSDFGTESSLFTTDFFTFLSETISLAGSAFTGSTGFSLGARSILPRTEGPESLSALAIIFSTLFLGSSLFIEITFLSVCSITTLSAFSFSNFSF